MNLCGLCLFFLCLLSVRGDDREKRTIGFLFRGLVDAAATQHKYATTPAPLYATTPPVYLTTTEAIPEKIRQPPRPMIYIIPVTNKSPQNNDLQNLAEVLKYVKGPLKIKNENGSDPDLSALIQATKHLTVDKRNVEKEELEIKEDKKEDVKKDFVLKIQAPKESNNSKQFTIKIVGDDVKIKKSKDGYTVGFSLPDSQASIRIEYPESKFEKQEQARNDPFGFPGFPYNFQQFQNGFQQFQGQFPTNQLYPPTGAQQYSGLQYPSTAGQQYPPTAGQQYPSPGQYPGGQQFQNQNFQDPYAQFANQYAQYQQNPYQYNYDQPAAKSEKVSCTTDPNSATQNCHS